MFVLLCSSTGAGFLAKSKLLAIYAQTGALESMNLIISFLVTITAIVVGLLINSTKSFIDATQGHWALFAGQLIQLDQAMRNYGRQAEPLRKQLQSFTAAVIVNYWRAETVPIDATYPDVRTLPKGEAMRALSYVLNRIEIGIIQLQPPDPLHERLASDCLDQYREFVRARWSLLLAPQDSLPIPFLRLLVAWIMVIFGCFGLRGPANPLVMVVTILSATTLSGMMFAIIDVVDPYKGLYNISSANMHYALDAMLTDQTSNQTELPPRSDLSSGLATQALRHDRWYRAARRPAGVPCREPDHCRI
ncbi:hypothetical protein OS122_13955 [Mycolicibacterium mucogenicum]|uniref:bestrophin-like domain n=1 Tax=Mycolicibacterium mucogenicum TaxID=56689 RepID=UPI00226AECEA|nr:hypothetical protein [Mycolicibacterium mucogenicum]MCX8561993.1 hypothetical protein [Mycolicibacterium mucogenicum]